MQTAAVDDTPESAETKQTKQTKQTEQAEQTEQAIQRDLSTGRPAAVPGPEVRRVADRFDGHTLELDE